MNTTEIKARVYDLLVIIEQAKAEINQLQMQLEKLIKEESKTEQETT